MDFENHADARVRNAYKIARAAHAGQVDKAGVDYINHPLTVASNVGDNISTIIVALLHDVAEDTAVTLEDLTAAVPLEPNEISALKLLTHDKNISYAEYIAKIKTSELATAVKIADLRHNSDLSRIPENLRTEKDFKRVEKYAAALLAFNRTN